MEKTKRQNGYSPTEFFNEKRKYAGLVYFFQRSNPFNDYICVQEHDADMYVKNNIFKLVGCSDGLTYEKIQKSEISKNATKLKSLEMVIKNIKRKLDNINSELSDITDPEAMQKALEDNPELDNLREYEIKVKKIKERVNRKAFDAELKVALKNGAKSPPDKDFVFFDKSTTEGGTGQVFDSDARDKLGSMGGNINL